MDKGKFLPKDPTKALLDVKEMLYDRLNNVQLCVKLNMNKNLDDSQTAHDAVDRQMENEIDFLTEVLNIIERS